MWLTRFGGINRESSSPGIAFQASLAPSGIEMMNTADTNIASPLAAMVATPRTAVTGAQQDANTDATLPAFKPGMAPTVVPESHAIGAGLLALIVIGGLWLFGGMKVR